jgi:TetR/AcrR family transcriptional regulator, transcriptional repressor for nem operon
MPKSSAKRRIRDPDGTREKLLHAAFEEIYRRGFQAASLDTILAKAGVTKGALYHHFSDKMALGKAVVDEVVRNFLLQRWAVGPLARLEGDPITALQRILQQRSDELTPHEVELGCPLNNLAQEMSPLDERFRRQIDGTFDTWRDAFAGALERGKSEGTIRRGTDPKKVASFVVAAIEGSFGLAKSAQSSSMLRANLEILSQFLESFRASRGRGKRSAARPGSPSRASGSGRKRQA